MMYYDTCCTQFLEKYRHLNLRVNHNFLLLKTCQFSTCPFFKEFFSELAKIVLSFFSKNKQEAVLYKFIATQIIFVIKNNSAELIVLKIFG